MEGLDTVFWWTGAIACVVAGGSLAIVASLFAVDAAFKGILVWFKVWPAFCVLVWDRQARENAKKKAKKLGIGEDP